MQRRNTTRPRSAKRLRFARRAAARREGRPTSPLPYGFTPSTPERPRGPRGAMTLVPVTGAQTDEHVGFLYARKHGGRTVPTREADVGDYPAAMLERDQVPTAARYSALGRARG